MLFLRPAIEALQGLPYASGDRNREARPGDGGERQS